MGRATHKPESDGNAPNLHNQLQPPPLNTTRTLRLFHPDYGREIEVLEIPTVKGNNEEVTAQAIGYMRMFAVLDSRAEQIRQLALGITQGTNTDAGRCARIFSWIQAHVRFQGDDKSAAPYSWNAADAEVITRPTELLSMPQPREDCDGFSTLCSCLLLAAGIPASFRTVVIRSDSDDYTHVYVVAHPAGQSALPMDTSHGRAPGWEVKHRRAKDWRVNPMIVADRRRKDRGRMGDTTGFDAVGNTDASAGMPGATGYVTTPGTGINYNNLINQAFKFVDTRYGDPTPAPGTVVQVRNADGSTRLLYGQQPGAGALNIPSLTSVTAGSSGLLMIGGGLVVLLVVASLFRGK